MWKPLASKGILKFEMFSSKIDFMKFVVRSLRASTYAKSYFNTWRVTRTVTGILKGVRWLKIRFYVKDR